MGLHGILSGLLNVFSHSGFALRVFSFVLCESAFTRKTTREKGSKQKRTTATVIRPMANINLSSSALYN